MDDNLKKDLSLSDTERGADGKQATVTEDGEVLTAIDAKAESRLVWKFDLRILPVLAIMYLFNSLGKSLQSHTSIAI